MLHYHESRNPEILETGIHSKEIDTAIRKSTLNKSPCANGIPNEAINACNEIGVKWQGTIFTTAGTERAVPQNSM